MVSAECTRENAKIYITKIFRKNQCTFVNHFFRAQSVWFLSIFYSITYVSGYFWFEILSVLAFWGDFSPTSFKFLSYRGGGERAVFALCPAQTKNARKKTDSLATFLNFKNTPGSLEKCPKKAKADKLSNQKYPLTLVIESQIDKNQTLWALKK